MPRMSKVELFAALRRESRAGVSGRALAAKYQVSRNTVAEALTSAWPKPRKPLPPRSSRLDPFKPAIDEILRADLTAPRKQRHTVRRIFARLIDEHGMRDVSYQIVRGYVADRKPKIRAETGHGPAEVFFPQTHRPGEEAEVDFGEVEINMRGTSVTCMLFSLRLSFSGKAVHRIFATGGQEALLEGHDHAFRVLGGVPGSVVYDRTKTVVRRHVAPGQAVPLHPEAVAFAGHYDFAVDVLAAYRPTGKGRVERQVTIVRDHVLAGRAFSSLDELDAAFMAWVPQRRALRHRTHGEIIGVRAIRDHDALRPVPTKPYVVADRHLRHVGKDCLVAYAGNLYSVPARRVRHRQLVEIRATAATVTIHATIAGLDGETLLAVHQRAVGRGARVVDETHWDGLPDGHTRAVTTSEPHPQQVSRRQPSSGRGPLQDLLTRAPAAQVTVEARPLSVYDQIAQASPFTSRPHLKDVSK